MDLYEKYGSYFLYDFTLLDLNWNQVANSTSYKLALGDPAYAGDMLICWARCGCSFTGRVPEKEFAVPGFYGRHDLSGVELYGSPDRMCENG